MKIHYMNPNDRLRCNPNRHVLSGRYHTANYAEGITCINCLISLIKYERESGALVDMKAQLKRLKES